MNLVELDEVRVLTDRLKQIVDRADKYKTVTAVIIQYGSNGGGGPGGTPKPSETESEDATTILKKNILQILKDRSTVIFDRLTALGMDVAQAKTQFNNLLTAP